MPGNNDSSFFGSLLKNSQSLQVIVLLDLFFDNLNIFNLLSINVLILQEKYIILDKSQYIV
jgi:hypothetical protein